MGAFFIQFEIYESTLHYYHYYTISSFSLFIDAYNNTGFYYTNKYVDLIFQVSCSTIITVGKLFCNMCYSLMWNSHDVDHLINSNIFLTLSFVI
jgi:hypothetical protein